jgi:hypothetical protein
MPYGSPINTSPVFKGIIFHLDRGVSSPVKLMQIFPGRYSGEIFLPSFPPF